MNRIVIIGGVAAGATAAARARRLSEDADITLLEAGPDISFANCGLPYYIGGDIPHRSSLILQSPESFLDQYNVDVKTQTRVLEIHREVKMVRAVHEPSGTLADYPYDTLVLAQGGTPLKPPIPGAELPHVFTLWTLSDMDRIDEFISTQKPKSAVVAGGGFIGLEMVEALVKRGLSVSVIEKMPHVMPLMEAEIAGYLQEELVSHGVTVCTATGVASIDAESVKLDSGETIAGDMVLLSVGVRPRITLARDSGLAVGETGGLLVNEYLQTSDENIYAAGDMVEIEHRVHGRKMRIPLAGPANRQGRIAATNALGGHKAYHGSMGTSVVRVFEAVAGSTGLSHSQAREAGLDAQAVTVHKEHHTSYYPGSSTVSVLLVYEAGSGRILGGQTAGHAGADKRLDVIATAIAGGLTVHDLAELDLSYSPPIGTANDALNMAAFAAENRLDGYSPSLVAAELDEYVHEKNPLILDLRDHFAFQKSHVAGALHIPDTHIRARISKIPGDRPVLVYDADGKYGHRVLRFLLQRGMTEVMNVSGGYRSLERYARARGFTHLHVPVIRPEKKSAIDTAERKTAKRPVVHSLPEEGPVIIDVRTAGEFASGACPGAVNIPLDELSYRMEEMRDRNRRIIVYCATGARSAYASRMLESMGFLYVSNGGGLSDMMADAR